MVRLLGQAGHKVIVAENDLTDGFSMTRFSRYVHRYINLSGSNSRSGYIEDLVFVWEQEGVDWFLPGHCKNYLYAADVEAMIKMREKAIFQGKLLSFKNKLSNLVMVSNPRPTTFPAII